MKAGYYWARIGWGWEVVEVRQSARGEKEQWVKDFDDSGCEELNDWEFGLRLEPPEEE